jgi:diamine N-acetyltransferase
MHTTHNSFTIRPLSRNDAEALTQYYAALSDESRRRYAPHAFNPAEIRRLFGADDSPYRPWGSFDGGELIAYTIIFLGHLPHDAERIAAYGHPLNAACDAFYAPSVADAYQAAGLAGRMLGVIEDQLRTEGVRQLLLWGGVQATNERARRFYARQGFVELGEFEYQGMNVDMAKSL